jgi:hypothetical protein
MAETATAFTPPASAPANPSPAVPQHISSSPRDARIADGVRSDPTQTPWQEKWQADYDQLTREDVWRNPDVVITKNADGTIQSRPRDRSASDAPPAAGGQSQQEQRPVGPASSDGNRLRVGDYKLSEADVRGLLERKSLEDSRRATLPASADKYELTLPSDFKMPDGMAEWRFDVNHPVQGPLLARAREIAHAAGMNQDTFSRMLGLHVANEVQQQLLFDRAKAAELNKLGELAAVRVDAVRTFVRSMVGDAAPALLMVLEQAPMASTIVAFEKLMMAFSSQGIGGFSGAARDGGDGRGPQRVSDEQYAAMSYFEKQQYAAQFPQGGR